MELEQKPQKERLQKILAARGIGSRRYCEQLILSGRVQIDGKVVRELGISYEPYKHIFSVDGKQIPASVELKYILLHKPQGVLCTCKDPQNRPIVLDYLSDKDMDCYPVGRLDIDTEGLVLLTNDGALANRLIHPKYKVWKRYRVWFSKQIALSQINLLKTGVLLEDGKTAPAKVKIIQSLPYSTELLIWIHEGRKRQIRRMGEAIGAKVDLLIREAIGPLELGELESGQKRYLSNDEVASLYNEVRLPLPSVSDEQ